MKVLSVLRTTLLVAAVLGMCAADAKKHKLCDADGHAVPAPTPAQSNNNVAKKESATVTTPVIVPTATPAPSKAKIQVASDADDDNNDDDDDENDDAPVAPSAPISPAAPGPASPAAPAAPAAPATPATTQAPASTQAPAPAPAGGAATNAGSIKGSFAYKGKNAGGPGTYQMVTDVGQCSKTPHAMSNPVSPLDDDLTLVFRGPMTIHNIAIFDGSSGSWNKVSSYAKGGATTNMVFMNNRNVDYSGASSPQGFSTADGKGKAGTPVQFAGELAQASSPNSNSIYADEKTGAEVNIFQDKKCGQGADCKGYYDKDGTAYAGWGGAKKIFVTKVQMPNGGSPNLPAIWALNGQIVRSGQYGCNCRGMGKGGGCGELDIAEVLEKDTSVVATHYYYYEDGTGHDSWGKRPTSAPATYITVIDESYGVKVLEVGGDDFDFNAGSLSGDVVSKWLSA